MGKLKKETHIAIIRGLEALSGTRIKPSHIPRVWNFAKEINQVQKINEILDEWIKHNPEIKPIIESERRN